MVMEMVVDLVISTKSMKGLALMQLPVFFILEKILSIIYLVTILWLRIERHTGLLLPH
jgi:hypothetical protein